MTAPEQRSSGMDANARGIAVLVVAVVVGLLLLAKAGGDGGGGGSTAVASDKDGGGATTTTLAIDAESTTTTAGTPSGGAHTPKDVQVLVLNGSGKTGVARSTTETVKQTGYTMLTPGNANTNIDATTVYFAEGYQADAEAVATILGKTADAVEAKPDTTLGVGADTANVVVVLGADVAPADSDSSGSTTTTTSG